MNEKDIREISISLTPKEASDNSLILKKIKSLPAFKNFDIKWFKIIRRSIDARKPQIKINLGVLVSDKENVSFQFPRREYKNISEGAPTVIIVGAGPAGLFAGLRAVELGLKPIILERGSDVDTRRVDIAQISRTGKVDPDSNYCFGEGGAGAFSDGKLFTRSKKRGDVREVLEILHQFGASEEILINSHPHIGSDKLPTVIKNIRETIKKCGGEVRFNTRMAEVIVEDGKAVGVKTANGEILRGPVFLATGHSARDVVDMLADKGVLMEAKGIAVGVRLEHPQTLIDRMQYHSKDGRGKYLPAAEYSFVAQSDGRGVYSFCMCPGGVIVPAVSDKDEIVVNGMSASARSGKWANSGYVVEIRPEDLPESRRGECFKTLEFQSGLEKKFSEESKGSLNAPAQKIKDFLADKVSENLPATSYAPGIHPGNFNELFPKQISKRLKEGLLDIGRKCKEFIGEDGVMIGLESRTSSPIRLPRDPATMVHTRIEDLYPVGEGAGYAGGIVSSAIDGINSINAYYNKLNKTDGSNS